MTPLDVKIDWQAWTILYQPDFLLVVIVPYVPFWNHLPELLIFVTSNF